MEHTSSSTARPVLSSSSRKFNSLRFQILVEELKLPGKRQILLLRIARRCGYSRSGKCTETIENLAAALGVSTRTIGRMIADLERLGWIVSVRESQSKYSHRVIVLGPTVELHLDKLETAPGQGAPRAGPATFSHSDKTGKGRASPAGGNPETSLEDLHKLRVEVPPAAAEVLAAVETARRPGPAGQMMRMYLADLVQSRKPGSEFVPLDIIPALAGPVHVPDPPRPSIGP